jgi:ubiquinone/menaquinone biosynthesis C-methylase UbiE
MEKLTDSPFFAQYIFDNAADQASVRFSALSAIFDPGTIRHLVERGVDRGWHCLEIGGGNGSIAAWLGAHVGPTGRVLVTDIDTRYLDAVKHPNIEVQRHDIVLDELPEGAFDLVHCRLVLLHLPNREQVLRRMIAALKPGGWLVDEEFDSTSQLVEPVSNPSEVFPRTHLAMWRLMEDRGVERRFGKLLPRILRTQGLTAVGAEGRMFMWEGGSLGAALTRANYEQIHPDLIRAGYITEREFENDIGLLGARDFMMPSPVMWAAWGQRPKT